MLLTLAPAAAFATAGEETRPPSEAISAMMERSMHLLSAESGFADVPRGSWYYPYVRFVTENNVMEGVGTEHFAPHTTLTRAMFATILWRLAGEPAAITDQLSLLDVATGQWYSDAIAWAYSVGIVQGTGQGTFSPGASITREQMAVMLFRFAEFMEEDITLPLTLQWARFTDRTDVSDWAEEAMQWAVYHNIVIGTSNTTLHPQGTATRAQGATVLRRFIGGPTQMPPEPLPQVNIRPLLHEPFADVKHLFGEQIEQIGDLSDEFMGSIHSFDTGIDVLVSGAMFGNLIDGIFIDYLFADSTMFHFDGIDGTFICDYVVARFGSPDNIFVDNELQEIGVLKMYHYQLEVFEYGVNSVAFLFDKNSQVTAILLDWWIV